MINNKLKKQYLIPVAVSALALLFVLSNTALAQDAPAADPPPASDPATPDIILNKDALAKAQTSPAECTKFNADVFNATGGKFKATWAQKIHERSGEVMEQGCYVVEAHAREGNIDSRSNTSKDLQNAIKGSATGISAKDITTAILKAEQEKAQANPVSKILGWFINLLLTVVAAVLAVFTTLAGEIMVIAIRWTTYAGMPDIVNVGWSIVRDFANMFFILIMIVIAIAAILRIEEYDYKHLLGEVVIMAILVNFSKVIAVTLIDITNTLVAMFAFHDIADIAGFVYRVALGNTMSLPGGGWMSAMVQGITKVVFMVVALGAFLAITGLFVVRLVGLYVLVIFSPIAYVFDILPATKNLAHQWWHKFIEYLIWAPVAMFMMRLAKLMVQNGGLQSASWGAGFNPIGIQNDSTFNYVILMGLIWGAVVVAHHAGMVGGNAIVHAVEHAGHKGAHFLGHVAKGYVGQKWNEWSTHKFEAAESKAKAAGRNLTMGEKMKLAALNPVASTKAWMAYSHEQQHIASEKAKATSMEVVQEARTGGAKLSLKRGIATFDGQGVVIPHREFLAKKEEREATKLFLDMAPGKKAQLAEQLDKLDTHQGAIYRRGMAIAALVDNHWEDIAANPYFLKDHMGEDGDMSGEGVIHDLMKRFLRVGIQNDPRFHDRHFHDDPDSERFVASDMNEMAARYGRFDYDGHWMINPDGSVKEGMKQARNPNGSLKFATNKYGTQVPVWEDDGMSAYAENDFSKRTGADMSQAQAFNFSTQFATGVDPLTGRVLGVRWVPGMTMHKRNMFGLLGDGARNELRRTPARNIKAVIVTDPIITSNPKTDAHVTVTTDPLAFEGTVAAAKANERHWLAYYARKLEVPDASKNYEKIGAVTIELRDATGKVVRSHVVNPNGGSKWEYNHNTKKIT